MFFRFHSSYSIFKFGTSLVVLSCLFLLFSCSSTANKSNNYLSVVIKNRTQKQIIADLSIIVANYGYSLMSQSDNEAVFETQPDQGSVIYYVQHDKNYKSYRNNYYNGYKNKTLKLPHFEMVFNFTNSRSGILVESKVEYINWEHINDINRNENEGIEVQRILNELSYNSQIDMVENKFEKYEDIHQLLEEKISTTEVVSYSKKNYIRKVVLSTADYRRQVKALVYVREELKKYCDFKGGVFDEENDNRFYSSDGVVIPNAFYNSFKEANNKKAFGIKSCSLEEGVVWRLMIKPKLVEPEKIAIDGEDNDEYESERIKEKTNKNIAKFKNPELYIYIHMLRNQLPGYMKEEG